MRVRPISSMCIVSSGVPTEVEKIEADADDGELMLPERGSASCAGGGGRSVGAARPSIASGVAARVAASSAMVLSGSSFTGLTGVLLVPDRGRGLHDRDPHPRARVAIEKP